MDQDHLQENEMQKIKWLPEKALQIAAERREVKSKAEKERYTHLNAEFQRIARRDKKAFLRDQCKEVEENNRMGRTREVSRIHRKAIQKRNHDPDSHDGMITHLDPDILKCKVKWALGSITIHKASGGDGISVELFQILKDDALKVLHSICQQI